MSNALDAYGTLLKRGDAATPTENFTTIAEITNLTPPPLSSEAYEATRHDGPGWDEYIYGLLRGGEISGELNFIPSDATQGYATGMLGDMINKVVHNYQIVFPDTGSTTWTVSLLLTQFAPEAPVDGKLTAAFTCRITGAPTLA